MNGKIGELQRNEVEIESDRVAFQKFIEMLSLEMEEKLGEERVSTDTEATSLQDMADQLGKQISAHLTPNRKIQENYQDLKEEVIFSIVLLQTLFSLRISPDTSRGVHGWKASSAFIPWFINVI